MLLGAVLCAATARGEAPVPLDRLALMELGARVYRSSCASCHGFRGDGEGQAARALSPKPRDFRRGAFKFRSTRSGELPVDSDLRRTVARGLPGTSMPGFGGRLDERELDAVVQYVKAFAPRFDEEPPGFQVEIPPLPENPPAPDAGAAAYERAGCGSCHGATGRGDGPSSPGLLDDDGRPIKARDLWREAFRAGDAPEELFRTLVTGLDGAPMPSYRDSLTDEEIWQVVFYVRSLKRPSLLHALFGAREDQEDW